MKLNYCYVDLVSADYFYSVFQRFSRIVRYTMVKNHTVAPMYDSEPKTEFVETWVLPHWARWSSVIRKTKTWHAKAKSSRLNPVGLAHSIRLKVHAIHVKGERRANKTIDAVLAILALKFVVATKEIKEAVSIKA